MEPRGKERPGHSKVLLAPRFAWELMPQGSRCLNIRSFSLGASVSSLDMPLLKLHPPFPCRMATLYPHACPEHSAPGLCWFPLAAPGGPVGEPTPSQTLPIPCVCNWPEDKPSVPASRTLTSPQGATALCSATGQGSESTPGHLKQWVRPRPCVLHLRRLISSLQ